MTIIDSGTTLTHSLGEIQFISLATPNRGSKENSVWRLQIPPHVIAEGTHQVTKEEIFVALTGTADVSLAGRNLTLTSGSALVVPPNTDFSLSNSGSVPFEAVVVLPVGGQARLPGLEPFVPPWAQ